MAAGTADWPPVKNVALTFHWHAPTSQADPTIFQANPTLASGDVKVSLDGGNFANIGTLPTAVNSGKSLEIVLSQTEMNSNNIVIIFSDAAGAEWCDMAIEIFTVTRQLSNLAYPATSGRSFVVDTSGNVAADLKLWLASAPNGLAGGYVNAATILRVATSTGAASGTLTLDASASAVDDFYKGAALWIIAGTGANQVRRIASYVGSTKVATIDGTWTTTPTGADFAILPWADVNTVRLSGTTQTARDIGASVLLSSGSGTGQLDFTSGVVKANLAQILGTALTETAGLLAGGFKKFFNIATPAATMDHGVLVDTVTTATTATNLTNAPTAGDFTATMKTSLNAATPAVTVSDKTGFSLSTAGVKAIWDQLTSALSTAGSIGKLLVDDITGDIYARLGAPAGASVSADIAAIKSVVGTDKTGYSLSTAGIDALFTRALTESYATKGSTPTMAQFQYEILQYLLERQVNDTTETIYKLDGSTPAYTGTLNSGTTPTSKTRAT